MILFQDNLGHDSMMFQNLFLPVFKNDLHKTQAAGKMFFVDCPFSENYICFTHGVERNWHTGCQRLLKIEYNL